MSWIGRSLFDGISGGLIGLSRFAGRRLEAAYVDYHGECDPYIWLAGMSPEILPIGAMKLDRDLGDNQFSSTGTAPTKPCTLDLVAMTQGHSRNHDTSFDLTGIRTSLWRRD